MAKIHDLFIVELAEVIKGYGNDPDDKDPFRLSEFYRFYELPNIAVSRENFEKMRPIEPERKTGRWEIYVISMLDGEGCKCSECGFEGVPYWDFCPNCGARMEDSEDIPMEYFENGGR